MEVEKFTANLPSRKVELNGFQSFRGLREGNKRVLTFDIEIKKKYNSHELSKLVCYLSDLVHAMELTKLN